MEWTLERVKLEILNHHYQYDGKVIKEEEVDVQEIRFVGINANNSQIFQHPNSFGPVELKAVEGGKEVADVKVECDCKEPKRKLQSGNIQCKKCPEKFRNRNALKCHVYEHHSGKNDKKIECDVCNKQFKDWSDLREHKYVHLEEKQFECFMCDEQFNRMRHLRNHEELQHKNQILECNLCDAKCANTLKIIAHLRTAHFDYLRKEKMDPVFEGIHTYECFKCKFASDNLEDLKMHIAKCQVTPLELQCPICMKMLSTKGNWKRHLKYVHQLTGEMKNGNGAADKLIKSRKSLRLSSSKQIQEEKKMEPVSKKDDPKGKGKQAEKKGFKCGKCSRKFDSRRELGIHKRIHNKSIKCPECNLKCALNIQILHHIRKQHGGN